ncbi:hypothetical protein TrRE_jg11501, partial [Triparma retinervis]
MTLEALNKLREEVLKQKGSSQDAVRDRFSAHRLLNPDDEAVSLEAEARSSMLLPLSLVVEGKQEGVLPTEENVKMAMQMRKLVVLASGTADLGIMSNEMGTMGGDFDLSLEDDEDDWEGEEEEEKK